MSLLPIKLKTVDRLVPYVATPEQLAWFRGKNSQEEYEQFIESTLIALVGLWFSYFASVMVGGLFSAIGGTFFAANGILRPYFSAFLRSSSIRGGAGLNEDESDPFASSPNSAAVFTGRVSDCVLRSQEQTQTFQSTREGFDIFNSGSKPLSSGYTPRGYGGRVQGSNRSPNQASPPLPLASSSFPELAEGVEGRDWIELTAEDREGRALVVAAPFDARFAQIELDMTCSSVVFADASTGWDVSELYAATDMFISDCDAWVGVYPYLDRSEFRRFLRRTSRRQRPPTTR